MGEKEKLKNMRLKEAKKKGKVKNMNPKAARQVGLSQESSKGGPKDPFAVEEELKGVCDSRYKSRPRWEGGRWRRRRGTKGSEVEKV